MTNRRADAPPITDVLDIAVRTFGIPEGKKDTAWGFATRGPSRWRLILDTETTTDESQRIRFGSYQLRYVEELREQGIFYDPDALRAAERRCLENYASVRHLKLVTLREFLDDVFVRVAYHWQATTIGFNLPFDLSQLATEVAEARGKMRPGFTFGTAAKGRSGPRIRVKHLSRRASLIEFSAAGQRLPRGQRRRQVQAPPRRSAFVDVSTLASALLSRAFSLGELAKHLKTPNQKLGTDEHGKTLTPEYLDYAVRDVQVTWECFVALSRRYAEHGLTRTPIQRVLSEAGIGKGYLREMGIKPWREMQPDFSPDLVGKIMATYFGGRTEVHQRRVVMRVLYCDFTSMYPTVSTLMGLWRYAIAKGFTWRDATGETRGFLERVTLADLQQRDTWKRLHMIVLVEPNGDALPVRAKYQYEPYGIRDRHAHYTIGLNHVTADQPLWYTLADCIASKLITNRAPKILKAIAFAPLAPQKGLAPVAIAGNREFTVDPLKDDFFKRIIELRMQTKGPERNALKLVANSTGYGIFVQLDVNERSERIPIRCHPANGRQFLVDMDKVEEPGEFFHPLLGTLITGAARLMLAISERLVEVAGLTWVFCDTDSMAIARPVGMSEAEFIAKVQAIRDWFRPLNPYAVAVDLFKLEEANFRIVSGRLTDELEPLSCFAISSKRYALFNIDLKGMPVIRKASAHGLGHLLPPYREEDAPLDLAPAHPLHEIGVTRWQRDFWQIILRAALEGDPDHPDFFTLPNFNKPAVSRYSVTTAHLWHSFDEYNPTKPDTARIRPFNFMLMYQADPMADWAQWHLKERIEAARADEPPTVIGPYYNDANKAARRCIDRNSGHPVPIGMLMTYRQVLAQYHLRPEPKFLNADYRDSGFVRRRRVKVSGVAYIGKEANRWGEQSYLGIDPEAEITYGAAPKERDAQLARLRGVADRHGLSKLAREAGVSRQHLSAVLAGDAVASDKLLAKLSRGAAALELGARNAEKDTRALIARVKKIGIRRSAAVAGMDAGHLTRLVNGKRRPTLGILAKIRRTVAGSDRSSEGQRSLGDMIGLG